MNARDRDDRGVERGDLPRYHRLESLHDPGRRDDRVERLVRRRAVTSASPDRDLELVDRRHHRSAIDAHFPDGELVPEMEPDRRGHPV